MAGPTTHTDGPSGTDLTHAGAGLALAVVQLGAIIPGFMAGLILTVALVAVIVLPLMVLGLVVALLTVPPFLLVRAAVRRRRRRRSEPRGELAAMPAPGT